MRRPAAPRGRPGPRRTRCRRAGRRPATGAARGPRKNSSSGTRVSEGRVALGRPPEASGYKQAPPARPRPSQSSIARVASDGLEVAEVPQTAASDDEPEWRQRPGAPGASGRAWVRERYRVGHALASRSPRRIGSARALMRQPTAQTTPAATCQARREPRRVLADRDQRRQSERAPRRRRPGPRDMPRRQRTARICVESLSPARDGRRRRMLLEGCASGGTRHVRAKVAAATARKASGARPSTSQHRPRGANGQAGSARLGRWPARAG